VESFIHIDPVLSQAYFRKCSKGRAAPATCRVPSKSEHDNRTQLLYNLV